MKITGTAFAAAIIFVITGCSHMKDEHAENPTDRHGGSEHGKHTESEGGHAPAHSEGSEGESSDLDREVADLIRETCEHGIATYTCDECRYETGFVKVSADLLRDGLVATTSPEMNAVDVPVAVNAEIRFDERRISHVGPRVDGVIKSVLVSLGDRVTKGQPLVEIDSISTIEARTELLQARGELALARSALDRATALHGDGIIPEKEYLSTRQTFDAASIRVTTAERRLHNLGAEINGAPVTTLRAPMDGTILKIHAVPGESARTDEALVTVGDNSVMAVWADLRESDVAAVTEAARSGRLEASIRVRAWPGREFRAFMDVMSPAMDETSRTVKIRLTAPNPDGMLLAGMFASGALYLPGDAKTLTLPEGAVMEDEGRTFIFVRYDDRYFVRRPVATGRRFNGMVEITQGADPSQIVAARGAFLLKSDVLRSKMGAGCAD